MGNGFASRLACEVITTSPGSRFQISVFALLVRFVANSSAELFLCALSAYLRALCVQWRFLGLIEIIADVARMASRRLGEMSAAGRAGNRRLPFGPRAKLPVQ